MSAQVAVFPGVFDPPTVGHLNIIQRLAPLFDHVHVVIAINAQKKQPLFTPEERLSMLSELAQSWSNVHIDYCEGLIVDFATEKGAKVIARGIRDSDDLAYEAKIAATNKKLGLETLFLLSESAYQDVCCSSVKREALSGGDISQQIPDEIYPSVKLRLCK